MEGHLLSASDDAQICLWDISGTTGTTKASKVRTASLEGLQMSRAGLNNP